MGDTLDLRRQIKRCLECNHRFSHDAMFCPFDGTKLEEGAWDPSSDPLLHTVVDGRYEVVGVLGEGGMGTVYDVVHKSLNRHFAMKVLRRDLARDAELAARFTTEARATASIKHPNIVAISDFGHLPDGIPYFVMELLVGRTLSQSIKGGGPIPAARGIKLVLKIASALGAAHEARIVHRDLKPENVFLMGRPESDSDDVRIVDFGAAMILGASRVTKAGIVFGTPHYMSPEQASGQPVDHRADIYALGVIMYEMFTGRVPFEADTYMGVLTQHMFVQPVPPSQVSAAARELGALEEVVLRALEKKPEMRFDSMEHLAAEIQRVVTFAPGGGVTIASGASGGGRVRASVPPPPPFRLANELELPTTSEIGASLASTGVRKRREAAQRAVLYGGIALAVAAAGVGAVRLVSGRGAGDPEHATDRVNTQETPGITAITAAPPSASALAPASASASAPAPASASAPASPSPSPSPAPSPTETAPSAHARRLPGSGLPTASPTSAPSPRKPPPKSSSSLGTEFTDPWAK